MVPCQPFIIVLSGSSNSGAKGVFRILNERIPDCFWGEIDPLGQLDEQYPDKMDTCIEEAAEIVETAAQRALSCIILWRFDDSSIDSFRRQTAHLGMPVVPFVLSPPLRLALSSRFRHEPTADERRLIRAFYAQERHRPSVGTIIDNSHRTTRQTATLILERLHAEGLVF